MKIMLTGPTGQLGWELARSLKVLGEVIPCHRAIADFIRPTALHAQVLALQPDVIVNAAAYTAVDQAEKDEKEKALAMLINGEAVGALADATAMINALLVHYSTDYVFDGEQSKPYKAQDDVSPINVYGRSKRVGEQLIEQGNGDWLIFRLSWLYAARGSNFLRQILQRATEHTSLAVVVDQLGTPTAARLVAQLTAHALKQAVDERNQGCFNSGLYHLTAAGQTSRHQFACEIVQQARKLLGEETIKAREVNAIDSCTTGRAARRPKYSVLCNDVFDRRFKLHRPHWQAGLTNVLDEIAESKARLNVKRSKFEEN